MTPAISQHQDDCEKAVLDSVRRRSAGLAERLRALVAPATAAVADDGQSQSNRSRLAALWHDRLGLPPNDREPFLRRLGWQDWSAVEIARVLADAPPGPLEDPPPDWLHLLHAACRALRDPDTTPPPDARDIAFAPLLTCIGRAGVERLQQCQAPARLRRCWLRPGAHDDRVAAFLVRRLEPVAAPALYLEFNQFRRRFQDGQPPPGPGDNPCFQAFIDHMRRGGWLDFLHRYPALAKAMARLTTDAVDALVEMFDRLDADFDSIALTFNQGHDPGPLAEIRPGLSDRHAGGRQVCRLIFANGCDLHYKPHCQRLDAALQQWLRDLHRTPELEFAGVLPEPHQVLARGRPDQPESCYGWVETVSPGGFTDAGSVARYFRRAGGLLALVHALGGRDFIMDNLVAGADGPHAIDAEALLQPLAGPAASSADHAADPHEFTRRLLAHHEFSVRDTGMLPSWQAGGERRFHDISGLGGLGGYSGRATTRHFTGVNTDRMQQRQAPVEVAPEANRVLLNGEPQSPAGHINEVCSGFERVYLALIELRPELLGGDERGWSQRFAGARCRFLFRSTGIYGLMLQKMAAPEALACGLRRSLEAEALLRPFLRLPERPAALPWLLRELESLEQWDVPRFELPLQFSPDTERGHLLLSPLETARASLFRLDSADLSRQLVWIRNTLRLTPDPAAPRPARAIDWRREALRLGDRLLASGETDFAVAIGRAPCQGQRHLPAASLGRDDADARTLQQAASLRWLYHGHIGLARLFAALHAVTGHARFADRARHWLEAVDRFLDTSVGERFSLLPVGACGGLSSIVHGMRQCAHCLVEPHWAEQAGKLAHHWFHRLRLSSVAGTDVTDGLAGLALAITAAGPGTGQPPPVDLLAIGRELLRRADAEGSHRAGCPVWADDSGNITTGFAHGAAGIGAALARIGRLTGDEPMMNAAADIGGWLARIAPMDPAGPDRWPVAFASGQAVRRPMEAWCHGTAGVLISWCELARLPAAGQRLPGLDRWIAWACQRLTTLPPHPSHDLCCGNFGRVEALLVASRLPEPWRPDAAHPDKVAHLAAGLLRHRNPVGLLPVGLREGDAWLLPPGFFRGYSGIGHTMLRLHDPAALPSPLAWPAPGDDG